MDHFCVKPWYNIYYSGREDMPCGTLASGTDIQQLKTNFINGNRPGPCHVCWANEDNDVISERQYSNEFLDFKLDVDIDKLCQDALDNKAEVVTYQINATNLCNAACVTCGSGCSTAWVKYEKMMSLTPKPLRSGSIGKINYKTAKSFIFTGGEPLLDKAVFVILEELIKENNTDCFISFVTNGSVKINKKHKEIMQNFANINFCISIDGIEQVFEYLRFPLRWDDILNNVNEFRSITSNISANFTLSNMSALYKDETYKWFNDQGIRNSTGYVTRPEYFSYDVMPGHELWNTFTNAISDQDRVKGINIKNYLPRMYKLIKEAGAINVQSI